MKKVAQMRVPVYQSRAVKQPHLRTVEGRAVRLTARVVSTLPEEGLCSPAPLSQFQVSHILLLYLKHEDTVTR